ncbi:MAG: hypothetical protein AB2598_16410 [Candidatus Thiodiazotropha sp.]
MEQGYGNSVNLVVALPAEAKPLIAKLNLKRDQKNMTLPLYSAGRIRLVVTGPGASAAAQGVHSIHHLSPSSHAHWINIGICGHGSLAIGTPLLADRIIDKRSGGTQSLAIPRQFSDTAGSLTCVSKPQADYAADMAYDMESWGFIEAVTALDRSLSATVFKIVSDNPDNNAQHISGKFVHMLMQQHLDMIQSLIDLSRHSDSFPVPQ